MRVPGQWQRNFLIVDSVAGVRKDGDCKFLSCAGVGVGDSGKDQASAILPGVEGGDAAPLQ